MENIKKKIRAVPDFPSPGIIFRDITTLLSDKEGFKDVVDQTADYWKNRDFTKIVGIDARGFILGGALAYQMNLGFVPVRKKGKLPPVTISQSYSLEYGQDSLEIFDQSLTDLDRVLIVDDLIATGGSAEASVKLVRALGSEVLGCSFIIDLPDLGGMKKIASLGVETFALCAFDGH
jgi:adenine phosphoribosyltransferase